MRDGTRIRVLWITTGLARGGTEQLLVPLARDLDRDRFELEAVRVLASYDAVADDLERLGVRTHHLGARTIVSPAWPGRLARLLRNRYTIVHSHSPVPGAVARLLPAGGARFVHSEQSPWTQHHPATRALNRATLVRNTRVLAISRAVADTIVRPRSVPVRMWPPVQVLTPGIDAAAVPEGPAARASARRALGLEADDVVIGNVANLSSKKDHTTLIDAFARVARTLAGARLVLVGFGPLQSALQQHAVTAGLAERVHFLGARDDAADLVAGFDVFVLTSRHEGFGIALLEAMAAGVPCVATAVDAIPELITDGDNGLLAPQGDHVAIAEAVVRVLSDRPLAARLAEHGRRTVRTSYSSEAMVAGICQVYEEVAKTRVYRRTAILRGGGGRPHLIGRD